MDEIIELYKKHVDVTLIRENLRKTPAERVRHATGNLRFFEEAQRAMREKRRPR